MFGELTAPLHQPKRILLTCAGGAVLQNRRTLCGQAMLGEGKTQHTAKAQRPATGSTIWAFLLLLFNSQLLQLKTVGQLCLCSLPGELAQVGIPHSDDFRGPPIKTQEVIGQFQAAGVAQRYGPPTQEMRSVFGAQLHLPMHVSR